MMEQINNIANNQKFKFMMDCGDKLRNSKPGAPAVVLLSLLIANQIKLLDPDEESRVIPKNLCGRSQNRIKLGSFIEAEEGVCRHRAILFKLLAERLNVCQTALCRGEHEQEYLHAWNYVKIPGQGVFLIDLTRQPGTLSLANSSGIVDYSSVGGDSILSPVGARGDSREGEKNSGTKKV